MSKDNANIFFVNQAKEGAKTKEESFDNAEFTLTEETGRNKVRLNIYKALTGSEDLPELQQLKFPPTQLTELIEQELITEFKECEKASYKSASANVIKRLSGKRFGESRRQLSNGEFEISDFIKGKNPKPQRRAQTTRGAPPTRGAPGANPSTPVNRTRGVRPPGAGNRGARGRGAPAGMRGGPRGARGRGAMPPRGGLSRAAEPAPAPPVQQPPQSEANEEQKTELQNEDERPQQPAIQVPKENTEEASEGKRVELTLEPESNKEVVNPPIKQEDDRENSIEENEKENLDNKGSGAPKMPKSGHRRGQPKPGNQGGHPPVMATRGRGHRPGTRGRGGRPPMTTGRPAPVMQAPQKAEEQPPQRVEIEEEEIVHEGQKEVQEVQESAPAKEPESAPQEVPEHLQELQEINQEGDFNLEGNKDFEESHRRKTETKDMFGKIFGDEEPEGNSRNRGRSPNFSEQRYHTQEDDEEPDSPEQPKQRNTEKSNKKMKTHRPTDLNKSVDLFGNNPNKIDTEELENVGSDTKDALNTSFGVEDSSALNMGFEGEERSTSNKMFATYSHDENAQRSKTPPVHSKRHQMKSESNDRSEYHKPIGAKQDFLIEEPVMEPEREEGASNDERSFETPQINENFVDSSSPLKNEDIAAPNMPSPIYKEAPEKPLNLAEEVVSDPQTSLVRGDREKILSEEEEKKDARTILKSKDSEFTDITIKNIQDNIRSEFGGGISTIGNNLKSLNVSRNDQTVPISRTSSVKSMPDELERAYESLKNKKSECEELQKELEEKDNELQVQIQVNETLKIELESERAKGVDDSETKRLQAENQELWSLVSQLKKEQESFKSSIFLTLGELTQNTPMREQSSRQSKEEEKYEEEKIMPINPSKSSKYDYDEYLRQEEIRIEEASAPMPVHNIDSVTQKMINNAAGSGSNQDDFLQERNNIGEEFDEDEMIDTLGHGYNEEGTSGGNAKAAEFDKEIFPKSHPKTTPKESTIKAEDRVIQGNERRGRQAKSNKIRAPNKTQETGKDSENEDEEEEKNLVMNSSSGIQSAHYKKREKGKQSQPFGRQIEGIPSSQLNNMSRPDPRVGGMDTFTPSMGSSHTAQTHNTYRQGNPMHTTGTGDSSYVQTKLNNRKDQKLSAESGGTDFNQNQSTTNQTEDRDKNPSTSSNYQYEGTTQGNATSTQRVQSRVNVPPLNIAQRPGSPDFEHRNYGGMGLSVGGNHDEDVLLGEHEVSTPRRKDQFEDESKKTSGASTPSRDGADTPTRKKFNEHQQQLGENKGFIHDLTATNISRKYPIDRPRGNAQNSEASRNLHSSNNTYPQVPFGEQVEQPQFNSQNSFEDRKNNESEAQNDRDNNYWEREKEQQVRDSKNRWEAPPQSFE